MFRRRQKQLLHARIRDFLWPRSGWKRSSAYLFHRVGRLPGTPYSVAAGFACGAAISFTPFVGLHFILGALCAWLMRANILASAIGTAIGNPWTFPFIWAWVYNLGLWMRFGDDSEGQGGIDFPAMFAHLSEAMLNFDMAYLFHTAWPVWWPMFLGGIPSFALVWLVFFFTLRPMIGSYQHRRLARRLGNDATDGH
ncbi:MAG TPA: DUF2062 domain-containing protein [Rhodospirillales bacterium]|nr:DUF2062 domain-containing protein [Rhodospirillales bacterium]